MQGLMASSKLSLTVAVVVFLLGMAGAAHGLTRVVANSPDEPCMNMTLYYHDILYNGNNTANATTAAATKPTVLAKTYRKNSTYFGALMVFNDPMTVGRALPLAGEESAAHTKGFYFYDMQESLTHWCRDLLYKRFLTPFRDGVWNRCQVSVGDRGVLPTRPRNRRGYALLAHTFDKMRSLRPASAQIWKYVQ